MAMRWTQKILRVNRCGIPVFGELQLPLKETTTWPNGKALSKFKVREHQQ